MADISPDNQQTKSQDAGIFYRRLEYAVPLLSFGGALLAILFWISDTALDFRISIVGCVLASWVLAYLAWIRPRKDIVALSTPIYSFIFISMTTDILSTVVLEILYAVSLSLLLARLKHRFGSPGTAVSLGKELGGSLKTYIDQTRDALISTSPEEGHSAAVVFVRFAEGNYGNAEERSATVLLEGETPETVSTISRAFGIIREHSHLLNKSLPRPMAFLTFPERDYSLLAKSLPPGIDEDTEFFITLDNALLLLYSAAWNVSEKDRLHLLACQVFAQKLMDE